ncbi:MAG: hypothetical protein FWD73_02300 [Polyangiaceae bacterium]|nr:hypothetical protein [Polyangiaceae bacterium]
MAIKDFSIIIMFLGSFCHMTGCTPSHEPPPRTDVRAISSNTHPNVSFDTCDHATQEPIKENTTRTPDDIVKAEKIIKEYLNQECARATQEYIKENTTHTLDDIVKAEKIIKEYLSQKYPWKESKYKICINSKESDQHIIEFMIHHEDDAKRPPRPGAGLFRFIEFDMQKMVVRRELRDQ